MLLLLLGVFVLSLNIHSVYDVGINLASAKTPVSSCRRAKIAKGQTNKAGRFAERQNGQQAQDLQRLSHGIYLLLLICISIII